MPKKKEWMKQQEKEEELQISSGGVAPENKSHGRNTQSKRQDR